MNKAEIYLQKYIAFKRGDKSITPEEMNRLFQELSKEERLEFIQLWKKQSNSPS